MALKTKHSIADIGKLLGKKSADFTLQDPPMIAAPSTEITDLQGNPRQIRDRSKMLKGVIGKERVITEAARAIFTEKGPNGELVYTSTDPNEDRFRLWGNDVTNPSDTNGSRIRIVDATAEFSFYGTGINLLQEFGDIDDVFVSIDGGAETDITETIADVLDTRNYRQHAVIPLFSGLAQGNHTLKLRKASTGGGFHFSGFEVLNDNTQVRIPEGEIFANGLKYRNSSEVLSDYNSGFDGSPVLNGRGGRVSVYITPEGRIGKAIQQTNATSQFLASANHSEEEEIQRYFYRRFGVGRSDDFTTLSTSTSNRAFTMRDGSTSLSGTTVRVEADPATDTDPDGYFMANTGADTVFTFTGTGVDLIFRPSGAGTINDHSVEIDGVNVGNISGTFGATKVVQKLASGLPYGTHTVRIERLATGNASIVISDYIVHGPKKPTLPEGAAEIQEYYLVADFDGSGTNGTSTIDLLVPPVGSVFKGPMRDIKYTGTWTASINARRPAGYTIFAGSSGHSLEYTFFGDGFQLQAETDTSAINFDVEIDGVANDAGVVRAQALNNGSGSYTISAGAGNNNARLEWTGLGIGIHTVKITTDTGAAGDLEFCGLWVNSPIHMPDLERSDMSLSDGVQLASAPEARIDLGEAKAWVYVDAVSATIRSSHNISAVYKSATGLFYIFFEKPFKDRYYVVAGVSESDSKLNLPNEDQYQNSDYIRLEVRNSVNSLVDERFGVAFFGELMEDDE